MICQNSMDGRPQDITRDGHFGACRTGIDRWILRAALGRVRRRSAAPPSIARKPALTVTSPKPIPSVAQQALSGRAQRLIERTMIGASAPMAEVHRALLQTALDGRSALLHGEPGTG